MHLLGPQVPYALLRNDMATMRLFLPPPPGWVSAEEGGGAEIKDEGQTAGAHVSSASYAVGGGEGANREKAVDDEEVSWYIAEENDTPDKIATHLRTVSAEQIVELNKARFPGLTVSSRLDKNAYVKLRQLRNEEHAEVPGNCSHVAAPVGDAGDIAGSAAGHADEVLCEGLPEEVARGGGARMKSRTGLRGPG